MVMLKRKPRSFVYRLRLDDEEQQLLRDEADRRGVPASILLRECIRCLKRKRRRAG